MTEEIKISILCLVYNHEPYLKEALEGFLMQKTDFKYEILVNEDASTDGSKDILKEYERQYPEIFKVLYQTENQYSKDVDVLALLYEEAKGKYFAICEGDDYWTDPYKLQKQVDFLEKNKDYYAVYHNVMVVDQNSRPYPEKQFLHLLYANHEVTFDHIKNANYLCGQTATIVCRNFWKEFNEQQKNIFSGLRCNGDVALSSLFTNKGRVYYMEDMMANYRKAYSNDSYSAKTLDKNMTYFYLNSSLEISRMLKEILYKKYQPEMTQYIVLAYEYYKNSRTKDDWNIFVDVLVHYGNIVDIMKYIIRRLKYKLQKNCNNGRKLLENKQ